MRKFLFIVIHAFLVNKAFNENENQLIGYKIMGENNNNSSFSLIKYNITSTIISYHCCVLIQFLAEKELKQLHYFF